MFKLIFGTVGSIFAVLGKIIPSRSSRLRKKFNKAAMKYKSKAIEARTRDA